MGQTRPFHRRAPRYLQSLPATVTFRNASTVQVTTVSLSEGGCCLAWSGPPPPVGEVLRLRVAASGREAETAGSICWRALEPRAAVGVQLSGRRAPGTWRALVAALAARGAPRA